MMKRLGALCAAMIAAGTLAASAQETCGGTYVVKRGDSLSLIADRLYKDVGKWTSILQANADKISSPNAIQVGQKYVIPCINGLPTGLEGGTVFKATAPAAPLEVALGSAETRKKINILTGDDFKPFTDRSLPNGGLLTEVVQAAMDAAAPDQGFAIHWVNDWSSHHEPLLSNALLDLGFPWFKPNCDVDPTTYRCANLKFSDSMFEVLTLMFVSNDNPIAFNTNADMVGKTLCRPEGYSTFIFDHQGRNWLKNGEIELFRASSQAGCFEALVEGKVDGVVLNEFSGRKVIAELGYQDKVSVATGQPLSIDGNHMVVHKSHPQGDALLAVFEEGLEKIKSDGTYRAIIDEHMNRIWSEF